MKLSVIVPALEEERYIGACVAAVRAEHAGELFVVDGGSHDGTRAAAVGATVLESARGYAKQANAGAAGATGDVLFFVAADSRPQPGWYEAMQLALTDPGVVAGGFSLRLDDKRVIFRVIEWGGNFRARHARLALPDQGLFVRTAAFHAAGGFPSASLIPNASLCFALSRLGSFRILSTRTLSSARKWHERGIFRATLGHVFTYRRYVVEARRCEERSDEAILLP